MKITSLFLATQNTEAYEFGYSIGNFIGENIYLMAGLLIGIIVAVIMRKNLKAKP
ncbi:hypothetical protein [Christiangramia sabulilitoris]|uniref:hypothetical protein n=1 Tax=Christiangramia sabulilitoris TaxID=2583991 RepID=UPI00140A22A4|nr:hypothetical protein [Christiangramia sabulilitoris]